MHRLRWLWVAPVAIFALSASARTANRAVCGAALAPLDVTNKAAPPRSSDADAHPERFNVVCGYDHAHNLDWADGQGYIHAPIGTVWAALRNRDVVADQRQLRRVTLLHDAEHGRSGASRFDLRCVTNSTPSVTYTLCWREGVTAGTATAPRQIVARDDLLQPPRFFGIAVISTLSDSVVLQAVDDHTTSVSIIRHVVSFQSDPRRTGRYLTDLYGRLTASVHGRPIAER